MDDVTMQQPSEAEIKDAIIYFSCPTSPNETTTKAEKLAKWALERELPKEAGVGQGIRIHDMAVVECPKCTEVVPRGSYCSVCGQALKGATNGNE